MMSAIPSTIEMRGLGKQKTAAFVERARRLGMTPQRYLRHLVEEDLAVSEVAKNSTFAELLGPGVPEDEDEIDRFVAAAKKRIRRRNSSGG